jgi:4-hydroxy-tetrahydrodipicolinate synthase
LDDTVKQIEGIFPAMVTPVDEYGDINEKTVYELVDYFVNAGVNGLYTLGTTGESMLLNKQQKIGMLKAVLKAADNRIPVMVHVGMLPVEECCSLVREVQEQGATFLSAIPPYYFPFSDADLLCYYRTILQELKPDSRLFLYNIPAFARNSISPGVVQTLCKYPNFAGIKDSQGDITLTQRYLEVIGNNRRVLVGSDDLIKQAFALGAGGSISGNANVLPELFVRLAQASRNQQWDTAEQLQQMVNELAEATEYGNLPLLKLGLSLRGISVGKALPPFYGNISLERYERLKHTLQNLRNRINKI